MKRNRLLYVYGNEHPYTEGTYIVRLTDEEATQLARKLHAANADEAIEFEITDHATHEDVEGIYRDVASLFGLKED